MPSAHHAPALAADLGATNARFALIGADDIRDPRVLSCVSHPSLAAAIEAYLAAAHLAERPRRAAIAIASPVTGDRIEMTNFPSWSFSITDLRQQLGLDRLDVINDFAAVALSIPHLAETDRVQIGGGSPVPNQPIGVLGPGTGLGVASTVRAGRGWAVLAGEGGHVTMPAVTEREAEVLSRLRQRFHHVSAERVISGQGLVNLYEALAALKGQEDAPVREPAQITDAALGGGDPLCSEAVDMFCAMLGTVAGNLALTVGARGGVYVAGGIVPRLGEVFFTSAFRERFEAKGRLQSYLQPIPTYLVTHPLPAFLGLQTLLEETV